MKHMMKILLLIVATNLVTIYFLSVADSHLQHSDAQSQSSENGYAVSAAVLLNATQLELTACRTYIDNLRSELKSSRSELQELHSQLDGEEKNRNSSSDGVGGGDDHLLEDVNEETKLSLGNHILPFGRNPRFGSTIISSYGSACLKHKEELAKYMDYEVGGECPMDDVSAQKLMLVGCEPLPRRRCHPKTPKNYVEPSPRALSIWSTPPDTSIVWDSYSCKNYSCLINRWHRPGTFDCKDCFDLHRREAHRWQHDNDFDYGIDRVLAMRRNGTIRIGLDIGGGTGTFAARMMERNVTIITTSMNFDGPFNSFISSRGLLSLHMTISQRFPFFENTLDIVHSMHVFSSWIPETMLEFILYDIYRILRPGGLFWLDHFFCATEKLNQTYVPMFERVNFKTLRWNIWRKADNGVFKNELYLIAVFEKPMT